MKHQYSWQDAYEAALLETDGLILAAKIHKATTEIEERISASVDPQSAEYPALIDAVGVLRTLVAFTLATAPG